MSPICAQVGAALVSVGSFRAPTFCVVFELRFHARVKPLTGSATACSRVGVESDALRTHGEPAALLAHSEDDAGYVGSWLDVL